MKWTVSQNARATLYQNQIHIFGLFGIAIAYPIFTFMQVNPAYLFMNNVTEENLYLVIFIVLVAIPALTIGVVLELRRYSHRVYQKAHFFTVIVLVFLSLMPLFSRIDGINIWLIIGLAALATGVIVHQYRTNIFTYCGFALLTPVSIIICFQFLHDHHIAQILDLEEAEHAAWVAPINDNETPVVMVVFDALPMMHLLDAEGNIDATRFPNFARLAHQSTWYSNASTVHDTTLPSIPAMLTGRNPRAARVLPTPQNHPGSLFEVLRSRYQIHAFETVTSLSGFSEETSSSSSIDESRLLGDLAVFYARSLLPEKVADRWVPLEEGIWGGFFAQLPEVQENINTEAMKWHVDKREELDIGNRHDVAMQFISDIKTYPQNTFHFMHVVIPHRLFEFLPDGRRYIYRLQKDISEALIARFDREAHILQLAHSDTVLGALFDELEVQGLWDDALIVVVADHGESFLAEPNKRIIAKNNIGHIGFVPLLIKLPGQRVGQVDDSNVLTTDIAPTVIDALGIPNGPRTDGRSLLDAAQVPPTSKSVASYEGHTLIFTMEEFLDARQQSHQEAVEFFSLNDPRSGLFHYGPGLEYLGVETETLRPKSVPCAVESLTLNLFRDVAINSPTFPALADGTLRTRPLPNPSRVVVAISINGRIRAVTQPYPGYQSLRFLKILSPDFFKDGKNEIEILLLPNIDNVASH